tara:strand:+ start:2613 stop:3029 length:417 start_codon:yes stop_codon:yes gene_type:complete
MAEETDTEPTVTTIEDVREMTRGSLVEEDSTSEISSDEALYILAECITVLTAESKIRSAASVTMDEIRNRAVYELNREVLSDTIDTLEDDTLPYLAASGSILDKIIALEENVVGAVNSIIDNSDKWVAVPDPEEGEDG